MRENGRDPLLMDRPVTGYDEDAIGEDVIRVVDDVLIGLEDFPPFVDVVIDFLVAGDQ